MTKKNTTKILKEPVGLVGLGLMGQGIATCLLAHGFEVVAHNRTLKRARSSLAHIARALDEMVRRKLTAKAKIRDWRDRYRLAPALDELAPCALVVETAKEDLTLKREIYATLEQVLSERAVISSNTSSIPISLLQEGRRHPERFIGMHWGEPVQVMRYLEITPGSLTSPATVQFARRFGQVRPGNQNHHRTHGKPRQSLAQAHAVEE